jgi:hypothetical protein
MITNFIKFIGSVALLGAAFAAPAQTNLLFNANGEAGDMTGWNIDQNDGNGWYVGTGYGGPLSGSTNPFDTSYGWDVRSQTIDLLAAGYSTDFLDSAPTVSITDWVNAYIVDGFYFMNVSLEDADQNVIASWSNGSQESPLSIGSGAGWTQITGSLDNYGSGLRYIVFQDGGRDSTGWAGNYGAEFDGSSVSFGIIPAPEPSTIALAGIGGLGALVMFRRRK